MFIIQTTLLVIAAIAGELYGFYYTYKVWNDTSPKTNINIFYFLTLGWFLGIIVLFGSPILILYFSEKLLA